MFYGITEEVFKAASAHMNGLILTPEHILAVAKKKPTLERAKEISAEMRSMINRREDVDRIRRRIKMPCIELFTYDVMGSMNDLMAEMGMEASLSVTALSARLNNGRDMIFIPTYGGEEIELVCLSHELIHIDQFRSGRGRIICGGCMMWNGELHPLTTKPKTIKEYIKAPWEAEAYANQLGNSSTKRMALDGYTGNVVDLNELMYL